MKMALIGGAILAVVLAVLFVLTGGLQSTETEDEQNGEQPMVVEPADAPQEPGNKNFNL